MIFFKYCNLSLKLCIMHPTPQKEKKERESPIYSINQQWIDSNILSQYSHFIETPTNTLFLFHSSPSFTIKHRRAFVCLCKIFVSQGYIVWASLIFRRTSIIAINSWFTKEVFWQTSSTGLNSVSMVCTCSPSFCWGGWTSYQIFKKGGLTGPQFLEEDCWE